MTDLNAPGGRLDRLSESVLLKLAARSAMVALTVVVVPAGGYLAARAIENSDRVADQVQETRADVKLIKQAIEDRSRIRDFQFSEFRGTLGDHEGRIRVLERQR